MDESKLVIACHCENMDPIHFVNPDTSIGPHVSTDTSFVDPSCSDRSWERIPSKSKRFVWGQNCPVYQEFRLGSRLLRKGSDIQLLNILRESYRILEYGGLVLFPIESFFYSDKTISEITNDDEIKGHYTVSIVKANEAPFLLGQYLQDDHTWQIPLENIIIFHKKPSLGGRKKRQSRKRRKTKRNHY